MCTIEIHLVVLPLANRWGTMLSSGKRIWFCISKLEPVKFGSSYDDDRWLYATDRVTNLCLCFTAGNIYFISLDLSICWRWCWFLAIWSFAVSLLRISNLFHFDSSCSHAWPHCMYEPAFMGGLLKWWIPKSPWLFQHWNDLVLDHLGVTPYWWIVDCARGKALQFLPKRVRRELLEGPTAQKKWEVSAEHSKRIWCWSVWNGSAECDSPPPPKNGGITS